MDARMVFALNRVTHLILTTGLSCLVACSHGGADDRRHDAGSDLVTFPADDFGRPADILAVDLRGQDLSVRPDLGANADLAGRQPCRRGAGWTAFSFHFKNTTTAVIDTVGLPDRSNFQVTPSAFTVYDDATHGGGLELLTGDALLIRFSLDGLTRISSATLTMFGRSYHTTSSGSFRASSPIHGDISTPTNAVSNAWPYDWTSVDYTANVRVGDAKSNTALRLSAGPSSNSLIVNTVELCIDAS